VSDRDGLAAFEAGFHHAAFVALAVLMGVLIAQVDFHTGDVIAESAQGTFHISLDLSDQLLMTFYGMVGIDLDLHGVLRLLLLRDFPISYPSVPVPQFARYGA
jgi:hypothetical protein